MKPLSSLLASLAIAMGTFAAAWIFFFPTYDTNDDIAIRLLIDGRITPGATPSGFAYFVNLGLGQILASLYRIAPSFSWYDLAEQGTLVLVIFVGLYCCARCIRYVEDAAFVILLCALFLSVFVTIQFTAVAYLSTTVGLCAIVSATTHASVRERVVLAAAGAVMVAIGGLFRLEAAVLSLLFFSLIYATCLIARRIEHGELTISRVSVTGVLASVAMLALSWGYHFTVYFSVDSWSRFYTWNLLRARLAEYGSDRLSAEGASTEIAAIGWTALDGNMLRQWLLIDPDMFSIDRMSAVASKMPSVLPVGIDEIAEQLASYPTAYPALVVGLLGTACGVPRLRDLAWMTVSFLGVIAIVVAISVILKPLEQRLVWPIGIAFILACWIFSRAEPGMAAFPRRLAAAVILLVACAMVLGLVANQSRLRERKHMLAMADIPSFMQGASVAVLVGGVFPFELVERPFGAPLIQRAFRALSVSTTLWAPPSAAFLARTALPDLPSWLCAETNVVVIDPASIEVLQRYYAERRNQRASFVKVYDGASIASHRCTLMPLRSGLPGQGESVPRG